MQSFSYTKTKLLNRKNMTFKIIRKLNIQILKRTKRKYLIWILNGFFGLCSLLMFNFALTRIQNNLTYKIAEILIYGIVLLLAGELFNVFEGFRKESVYSFDKIAIYPVSKWKHLLNIYLSFLYNSRLTLYLLPTAVFLFYSLPVNFVGSILFLGFTVLGYVLITCVVSSKYFVLNYIYCRYGENTQKILVSFILFLLLGFSLTFEYVEIPDISIKSFVNYIELLVK